ncbi:MAG: PAS domain-containing protein [Phycisphaerae bacterium]
MKPDSAPDGSEQNSTDRDSFGGKAPILSDARTLDLLESISDGFFALDEQMTVIYMNPQGLRELGRNAEEVIGKHLFETFPVAKGTIFEEKYTWALKHKEFVAFETQFEDPDLGNWYDVRVYPMAEGISIFFQVTTERHQRQQALAESEKRYRALTDALPDAVLIEDVDLNIFFANAAAGEVVGRSPEEMVGLNESDLYPPEMVEYHRGVIREVLTTGREQIIETDNFELNGRKIIYNVHLVPLNEKQVLIVARDISHHVQALQQRQELETQIQQAQKLESLGVLAGGIAHDFNNLLVGILGNADLALLELSPVSPVRQSVQEIEKAARRAAELCRQMLAYSGKGRFVVEPIDLSELVCEMGHMLEVSVSKSAVLKYNCSENLPPVMADATQIRQVVMNLITNASEAIGDRSGVISITTGALDCSRQYLDETYLDEKLDEGLYVTLEVADTGCGMDIDTRERIFDPFFTTKFTGRGLGLAAVLGIVRGHEGAIKVYSEPGQGTTFKVLLPASPAEQVEHESSSAHSKGWQGQGLVLVADDEPTVLAVTRRMLESMGFEVILASDGKQALDLFGQHHQQVVCVLLDLTMPNLDGKEAFRQLRQMDPHVPVVMASGYNEQEVSQRFLGKGLAGFIQKPFNLLALSTVMQKVLGENN